MDEKTLHQLADRFGHTSSWAIWDEDDPRDTSVIDTHRGDLHNRVVLVGLNASSGIARPWGNFHSPSTGDRKLIRLFNRSSYRGAYMTDLLKDHIDPDSSTVTHLAATALERNMLSFKDEMDLLGADASTLFVLFGHKAQQLFYEHLSFFYRNVVMCRHFAYYGVTTDVWAEDARETLTNHWARTRRIDERDRKMELNTLKFEP